MRTWIEAPFRRVLTLTAAGALVLSLVPASRLAAQPDEDTDEDPPRQDIHMGNGQNMRMGRNAQGDVIMEVHPPAKDPAAQPQVGPFFIYPQIGMPPYGRQGGQAMPPGQPGRNGSRQGQSWQPHYGGQQSTTSSGPMGNPAGAMHPSGTTTSQPNSQSSTAGSTPSQPTTSGTTPGQSEQPSANQTGAAS